MLVIECENNNFVEFQDKSTGMMIRYKREKLKELLKPIANQADTNKDNKNEEK